MNIVIMTNIIGSLKEPYEKMGADLGKRLSYKKELSVMQTNKC